MEQGHIHTESLRSRPVEVSVSATPPPYPQQEHGHHRRQGCHHLPSVPSLSSRSLVSNPEAALTVICSQVKTKPYHRGWRAAGLLLLLTLVTAGAMAGGLLGFKYSPPKVSHSSNPGVHRVGRKQEG